MSENSYILVIKFALLLGVPKLCSHSIVDHQRERHIETIKSFFCPISVFLEGGTKPPPLVSRTARVCELVPVARGPPAIWKLRSTRVLDSFKGMRRV